MLDTTLPPFWFGLQAAFSAVSAVLFIGALVAYRLRRKWESDVAFAAAMRVVGYAHPKTSPVTTAR
jgi:hypothetical protein